MRLYIIFIIRLGRLLGAPYTDVNDPIRLYLAVIHVIVLRSYISVTVCGAIRSYTEENEDCIRPPCTKTMNDRFFRISPYVSVSLRKRSFTSVFIRRGYIYYYEKCRRKKRHFFFWNSFYA